MLTCILVNPQLLIEDPDQTYQFALELPEERYASSDHLTLPLASTEIT